MSHSHRLLVFTISSTKELKSRCWLSTCTLAYWLRKVIFSPGPVAVVVLSLFTSGAWDNIITFDITQVKKSHKITPPSVSKRFIYSLLPTFCPDFHLPSYSLTPPMKCFQVSRANFNLKSYTRTWPLYHLEKTLITEMINWAFVHSPPAPTATPRYFLMKKTGMFVVSLRGRNCGF